MPERFRKITGTGTFLNQVIYLANVETFCLESFWGKGWKRQWHVAVHSDFIPSEKWCDCLRPSRPVGNNSLSLRVYYSSETINPVVLAAPLARYCLRPLIATLWICFVFHLPIWPMNKITRRAFWRSVVEPRRLFWSARGCERLRNHMIYIPQRDAFITELALARTWS